MGSALDTQLSTDSDKASTVTSTHERIHAWRPTAGRPRLCRLGPAVRRPRPGPLSGHTQVVIEHHQPAVRVPHITQAAWGEDTVCGRDGWKATTTCVCCSTAKAGLLLQKNLHIPGV